MTPTEASFEQLNHPDRSRRLQALNLLVDMQKRGRLERPPAAGDMNNHIHTFYSFSPYSPAKVAWLSVMSGLTAAGIMDHDSISGAEEFIEAGRILRLPTTIGVECRCDFSTTPLKGRRINNPDQRSVAYIAMHGIPHSRIYKVMEYFRPYLEERNRRNRRMVKKLNAALGLPELELDFERDVVPLAKSAEQGSITERHILFALAMRMIASYGRGKPLISFMRKALKQPLTAKIRSYLEDETNPYYPYDLLGALKSDLVETFYIGADAECPDVREALQLARSIGAISAYAYLGDVGESVTGDKKSQSFEDGYLEQLFETLVELGFQAVTYMPNRNTEEQLARVQQLCERHSLFQISGVDINSPRQSFTCPELRRPEYHHLIEATWALIGHELESSDDLERGMFAPEALRRYPRLADRIASYAAIGRKGSGASSS